MFFVNILAVLYWVSSNLITNINSKLSISLYLKDSYNLESEDVNLLVKRVEKISDKIVIKKKSKEEAFREFQDRSDYNLEILDSTPFPNTINISHVAIDEYAELDKIITAKSFVLDTTDNAWDKSVSDYKVQYNNIVKLIWVLDNIKIGLYLIISTFLVSIFIIIYSIINNFIYHYKDEIYITKLVWGSNSFIYWPFSIQGAIYSVISFLISFTAFYVILNNIDIVFSTLQISISKIFDWFILPMFIVQLLIFVIIWGVSWYLSSKKYLK